MFGFVPISVPGADPAGDMALYDKLKELGEWVWSCLTCKLPCCSDENYNNLNEEEEEPHLHSQQPPENLDIKTEPIQIETATKASQSTLEDIKDVEEVKVDIKNPSIEIKTPTNTKTPREVRTPSDVKSQTQFDDLELTSLNSLTKKLPIEFYPKGEIFIISSSRCHLLAKIREIKLNTSQSFLTAEEEWKKEDEVSKAKDKDSNFRELGSDSKLQQIYEERYSLFSEYRKGIKLSKEDWLSTTPELIAQHVAKRLGNKFKTILDAFCGAGSNTIQLALQCENVFATESSEHTIEILKKNAEIYNAADKIEFVGKNFFDVETVKAEAVFINMGMRESNFGTRSLRDSDPSLGQILDKAFEISDSFALLAPSRTRLEELAEILYEKIEKHEKISKRAIIEVEQIKIDDVNSGILVLYGDASSVSVADELKAIETIFKNDGEKAVDLESISQTEGVWKAFKLSAQATVNDKNESVNS